MILDGFVLDRQVMPFDAFQGDLFTYSIRVHSIQQLLEILLVVLVTWMCSNSTCCEVMTLGM